MYLRAAIRSALAVILFAVFHSALAALPVKQSVRNIIGERRSDALYRFAFSSIAVLSFAPVVRFIWTLPDRSLYRASGLLKALMLLGQASCVVALLQANYQNGFGHVSGIRHLWQYLTGQSISRPPVAQHPLPEGSCLEGWTGAFRLSSHPNNYYALLLYWLSPVMTVKWAAVGLVTAAYMVLGSMHEDHRLYHAYGERYACYRSHVPHLFLLPIDLWRRRNRPMSTDA